MTTNGDEDLPVTNGNVPCSDGDIEGSIQETSCSRCQELQQELQHRQRDHTFYTALKKKISLTDSLIRKYNSKCQEFDQQQKKFENVTVKLASSKRDCKVLEEQLTTTLKEVIPWKLDKEKFIKELVDCQAKLRETKDKLDGSEASCIQFEGGFLEMKGRLDKVEGKHWDLKRVAEKNQQIEKKVSSLCAKTKEDLVTCRKELSNTKRREAKLIRQHQNAKGKISELVQVLQDHGFTVPKIPKSLLGGAAYSQDGTSTEDTDFDPVNDAFSPSENILSPANQGTSPSKEPEYNEQIGSQRSQARDACLQIFDQFSSHLSLCMSPLPPSPQPPLPGQGEEKISDASSDISRGDGSNDESFSDVADQIESQLNLLEVGGTQDVSPEVKVRRVRERRQLRKTPQRKAKARQTLREVDNALQDDSEDNTPEKESLRRRLPKPSPEKGETEMLAATGKPESLADMQTDVESERTCHLQASSHLNGDNTDECHLQVKCIRQRRPRERTLGSESGSTREVNGRNPAGPEKYRERHFNPMESEQLFGLSSTLSEDSDDSLDENIDSKNELGRDEESTCNNSLPAQLKASSPIKRGHILPAERDLKKSQEEAVAKSNKLLLSPDRRMTRFQLKTLTELGVIDHTDIAVPDVTLQSGKAKQISHTEKTADMQNPPELNVLKEETITTGENKTLVNNANAIRTSLGQLQLDRKDSSRRPVTRSLFLSENESSTGTAPSSPAKSSSKRPCTDRSNSVPGEKINPDESPIKSPSKNVQSFVLPKTEQETSTVSGEDLKSPSRPSPRRLLRSASLTEHTGTSENDADKARKIDPDSKLTAKELPENSPKRLSRSVSVPGNTSSGTNSNHSEKSFDDTCNDQGTRRVTRSQVHTLGNPSKDMIIPRRMTRSTAQNLASKADFEVLPHMVSALTTNRPHRISNSDFSSNKGEEETCAKMPASSAENQESSVANTIQAGDTHAESRNTPQDLGTKSEIPASSESEQTPSKIFTRSGSSEINSGLEDVDDVCTHQDETAPCRRVMSLLSSSEMKLNVQSRDLSPVLTSLETCASGDQSDPEVHKALSCHSSQVGSCIDNDNKLPGNKQEQKPNVSTHNSISDCPRDVQATQQHSGEKLQDSQHKCNSEIEEDHESQEVSLHSSDLSSGRILIPVAESPNLGACGDEAPCSNDGAANSYVIGEANPCDLSGDRSSSSGNDPCSKDDVQEEIAEHQAAGLDEDSSAASVEENRNDAPDFLRAICQSNNLPAEQHMSILGTSTSNNQVAYHQVQCVEAESSRASTPTTDEVISINSMSGHVSPVSPLSFQRYNTARPLSPLSTPPRSPPLSPLIPSPLVFDPMVSIPRMLSPLPPSPEIPDFESVDEIRHSALSEGVPGAALVNQPRMISPLFPTPVPPAVSPLPEAPMPNVLSPLNDTSPLRLGHFPALDRSPMISPLRNPLIPSPCNFHAEAPRDALSVRPQHHPATRRQPASRCLAASFTTTTVGMNLNPEIISPRLHSLASEMVFEFGESNPSTSGLHLRQQPLKVASSSSSQESRTEDQATSSVDNKEEPKDFEEQRLSSIKPGFIKLHSKSASQDVFSEENTINSRNLDERVQKQPSKEESKHKPPQDVEKHDPPRTRSRNKQTSSQKNEPEKSCKFQKEEGSPTAVPEDKVSTPGKDAQHQENAVSRRCTRSQAGSHRVLPSNSDHQGNKRETSSRNSNKDSDSLTKTSKRRKRSRNRSEEETTEKDAESKTNQQTAAPSVIINSETEMPQGSRSPPSCASPGCKRSGKVILIAALEHKTKGFKKSGSLRKKQEVKPEADDIVEVIHEDGEGDHSAIKEKITVGTDKTEANENVAGSSETRVSENAIFVGDENKHVLSKEDENICKTSLEKGSPKALTIPGQISGNLKGTSGEKPDNITVEQRMLKLQPLSRSGSQLNAPASAIAPPNTDSKMDGKAASKPIKAKSKIGSIWGDIASQKDPGFVIFNRGLSNKRKHGKTQDWDPSQPLWITNKTDSSSLVNSGKQGGTNIQTNSQTQVCESIDICQANSASTASDANPQSHPKTNDATQHVNPATATPQQQIGTSPQSGDSNTSRPTVTRIPAIEPGFARNTAVACWPKSDQQATNASRDELTAGNAGRPVTPHMGRGAAVANRGLENGQRNTSCSRTRMAEDQEAIEFARTGINLANRKRHVSREHNSVCDIDELPTPHKQLKMSSGQQSVETRSKIEQSVPEVTPPVSKVTPSVSTVTPSVSKVTPSVSKVTPPVSKVTPPVSKVTPPVSKVTPSVSKVTPSVSKVKSSVQTSHQPVLGDLLRRIKELRSQTNAKPLFASILTFLGQQSISLMPAIQAKCLANNTSTRPLLLPHEEELISCITESGLSTKKSSISMFLSCLCRGVQKPPPTTSAKPAVNVGAAYCRVFSSLGRQIGLIDRIRVFCYDLLREGCPNAEELLLNIAVTWPTVLRKKEGASSPICEAIEVVTMQRLVLAAGPWNLQAQELIQCFIVICGWKIPEGNVPATRCHQLVASIQDTTITKLYKTGIPTQSLTTRTYEIVKALELLAYHQGWQWANDHLIRNQLWPVLKKWSQEIQTTNTAATNTAVTGGRTASSRCKPAGTGSGGCVESPGDASACAVMKVISGIACMGLMSNKPSAYELLKMLAAVLQQPTTSVPWTVQVFTAEAIFSLSPSDPTFALEVMQQWRQKVPIMLPARIEDKLQMLTKVVSVMKNVAR